MSVKRIEILPPNGPAISLSMRSRSLATRAFTNESGPTLGAQSSNPQAAITSVVPVRRLPWVELAESQHFDKEVSDSRGVSWQAVVDRR